CTGSRSGSMALARSVLGKSRPCAGSIAGAAFTSSTSPTPPAAAPSTGLRSWRGSMPPKTGGCTAVRRRSPPCGGPSRCFGRWVLPRGTRPCSASLSGCTAAFCWFVPGCSGCLPG
ncbi:MAG: hypothetical protein AVDCRST_MAG31-1476, partial [uncultured Sphingomonas sp.]